jgi:hypothetical protein
MSQPPSTQDMKRGDIVQYSRPVSADEAALRFVLLAAPEKDRVDIQLICEERIKPIETVAVEEIELASSDDQTKTSRSTVA